MPKLANFQERVFMVKTSSNGASFKVKDHIGNKFKSVSAMAKHYGMSRCTYISRIKSGWSIEEALTVPILKDGSNFKPTGSYGSVEDHLGNKFNNNSQMARHWGITPSLYHQRINLGLSKEEALTTPVSKKNSSIEVTDHLGNQYKSLGSMARAYGIKPVTLSDRLSRGWSIEEALTTTVDTTNHRKSENITKIKVQDNLGNWYDSYYELAKAYGLSFSTVYGRIVKLKWSIEKALLTPTQERKSGTRKRGIA